MLLGPLLRPYGLVAELLDVPDELVVQPVDEPIDAFLPEISGQVKTDELGYIAECFDDLTTEVRIVYSALDVSGGYATIFQHSDELCRLPKCDGRAGGCGGVHRRPLSMCSVLCFTGSVINILSYFVYKVKRLRHYNLLREGTLLTFYGASGGFRWGHPRII